LFKTIEKAEAEGQEASRKARHLGLIPIERFTYELRFGNEMLLRVLVVYAHAEPKLR